MIRWWARCAGTGILLNVRGLSWKPAFFPYEIQWDVITSMDIITSTFPLSIDFEYALRASVPLLIILHPIIVTWFSWAGIFSEVWAVALQPFLIFSIVDCNNFSNPHLSLSILSVDLKAINCVCQPVIAIHVQARASCWSTVCTRAPNIFVPHIGLKCNLISLWDVIYKRERYIPYSF